MTAMIGVAPGQSQEPRIVSWSPTYVQGARALGPHLHASLGTLAGSCIGIGTVRNKTTVLILNTSPCCSSMSAPNILFHSMLFIQTCMCIYDNYLNNSISLNILYKAQRFIIKIFFQLILFWHVLHLLLFFHGWYVSLYRFIVTIIIVCVSKFYTEIDTGKLYSLVVIIPINSHLLKVAFIIYLHKGNIFHVFPICN